MVKNLVAAYQEKPNHVDFESRQDGEEIVLLLRQHWVRNAGWLFFLCLMLTTPVLFLIGFSMSNMLGREFTLILLIIWYLITLAYGLESFLHWYFNVYIVTNKRIIDIDFYGLLHKEITEASLDHVQDVTYRVYGLAATIFNYGDVLVQTAAQEARFDFLHVAHPAAVHDKLTDIVHEN